MRVATMFRKGQVTCRINSEGHDWSSKYLYRWFNEWTINEWTINEWTICIRFTLYTTVIARERSEPKCFALFGCFPHQKKRLFWASDCSFFWEIVRFSRRKWKFPEISRKILDQFSRKTKKEIDSKNGVWALIFQTFSRLASLVVYVSVFFTQYRGVSEMFGLNKRVQGFLRVVGK